MKAIAQALTFRELDAIRSALGIALQYKDQLPLETKPTKKALEKVDRVIDDMRRQQSKNLYFLIVPVELVETTEEQ